MIVQYFCLIPFLFNFIYVNDITLGAPDTVKILVDPIKVVEKKDTIIVLDQEDTIQFIKRYTIDGFYIDARLYSPKSDSLLFYPTWNKPNTDITQKANELVRQRTGVSVENQTWIAMFGESDSMIWLVCSWHAGDGGGLAIFGLIPNDTIWRVSGYGPSADEYSKHSVRGIQYRPYFYVSSRYIYMISGEYLWQYDKHARFVRKIGIEPNQCFKEPSGIAIDNHGYLYITDFRLGIVWEYRPGGKTLQLRPMQISEEINPETPTSLAYSEESGLWVNDIKMRLMKNIIYHEAKKSFVVGQIGCRPGGTDFHIAAADSFMFAYDKHYSERVFKYSLYGQYIETYERLDYEGKKDNTVGMDNKGNIYTFHRGDEWSDVTFYRIDPVTGDTTAIVLPDSFQPYRLNWADTYRRNDTLYMLGNTAIYRIKGESSAFRGFFVFVNDTLDYVISESEFEGNLPERITDFAVQSYGLIWVVDIDKRIVQRYRLLP